MFKAIAGKIDAIQNPCLRTIATIVVIFAPIGFLVGSLESFVIWQFMFGYAAMFAFTGLCIGLLFCGLNKLGAVAETNNDGATSEQDAASAPAKIETDQQDLPAEKRRCPKCGNTEMAATTRNEFITDSYTFVCPNCQHKVGIEQPGVVGLYSGASLIFFLIWLFLFLEDDLRSIHDYYAYVVWLLLIWGLPASMAWRSIRHPVTFIAHPMEKSQVLRDRAADTSNPLLRASRTSNIFLSNTSFLGGLLLLLGAIAAFLGVAMVIGLINHYFF